MPGHPPPANVRHGMRVAIALACLVAFGEARPTLGAELTTAEFFGRDRDLARQLESRVTLAWQGVTLRQATERLIQTQGLPIWIDRRLDPTQVVDLDLTEARVRDVCDQLAEQTGAAWVPYGRVAVVGPQEKVAELRTLRVLGRLRLQALAEADRETWLRPRGLSIPRLAEPRTVVSQLVEPLGLRLANLQQVPHDVWPARELPAMAPADQLTLLLAGHDLTWKLSADGSAVEIGPIARPVVVERRLPARPDVIARAGQLAAQGEGVEVRREGDAAYLLARVEQHEQLAGGPARPAAARRDTPPPAGRQVYSLTIRDQPLEGLLQQLTTKLGLKLEISPELNTRQRGQRVSFSVTEVAAEELFAAIGAAAGINVEVTEGTVRIGP